MDGRIAGTDQMNHIAVRALCFVLAKWCVGDNVLVNCAVSVNLSYGGAFLIVVSNNKTTELLAVDVNARGVSGMERRAMFILPSYQINLGAISASGPLLGTSDYLVDAVHLQLRQRYLS